MPTVGEAKEQIERDEGTKRRSQLLCRVQVSSDGSNVREFDQEPEELQEDGMALEEGDVIAMGVVNGLQWQVFPEARVAVGEEGKLATQRANEWSLTHTREELTEGRHDWEVAIVDYMDGDLFFVGVCRPDADITASHFRQEHTTAWLISDGGRLFGNGKGGGTYALVAPSVIVNGDRMGILLDLDDGSLRFFRNGVEHGPGYPAGSVTGPVALAAHMSHEGTALRLLPDAAWPAGHAQ